MFIGLASGGQKNNFGQIWTFGGLLYRPPFTDEGQIWCAIADPRWTITRHISSRSVYTVALCWRQTPILSYFGLRHLVSSPFIGNNLTKLNTSAQLQTFPYPTISKSFLYSNALMAKSGAQSPTFKPVTNRETDRHTDKKTQRFGHPSCG